MLNPNLPEPNLLKTLLEPLLDDFVYWFNRSKVLLETEEMTFLGAEAQANLLGRVMQALGEVNTAKTLLTLTNNQVGVEMEVLMPWHKLLNECWQVSMRNRMEKSQKEE